MIETGLVTPDTDELFDASTGDCSEQVATPIITIAEKDHTWLVGSRPRSGTHLLPVVSQTRRNDHCTGELFVEEGCDLFVAQGHQARDGNRTTCRKNSDAVRSTSTLSNQG